MRALRGVAHRLGRMGQGSCLVMVLIAVGACEDAERGQPEELTSVAQALSASVSLQNGVNGYSGMVDTHVKQANPSTNYGNSTTCESDGDDGNGVDKSCLMQWDVTSIPSGAVVQSAAITLYATNGTSNNYSIYTLRRPWSEVATTWNQALSGVAWQNAGAIGGDDRGELIGSVTGTGTRVVTLNALGVAAVQRWIQGQGNQGIVIANATNSDGVAFASSEYSTISSRPKLTIAYTAGAVGVGGAGGASSTNAGAPGVSTGGALGTGSVGNSGLGGVGTGGVGTGGVGTGGIGTGGVGTGGVGTGGVTATGGAATGGTIATVPDANLLVAFLGDQGNGSNADAVLNLVKSEGAAAAVHNGDFDYVDSPSAWNGRIDRILGANYPYFAVVGNHDAAAWDGSNGYASYINARVARVPEMQCTGDLGVKATCRFHGLYLVQSCVGTSELSGHGNCSKDSPEQRDFLRSSLSNDASLWSICLWHKNQNDMQIGTKSDEVGWNAYRECMSGGAIIATGHEHSYARTVALTDLGNGAAAHGKVGPYDTLTIGAGRTFVFVSGLGGESVRNYDSASHADDTWWASQYAANRWMKSGAAQSGSGTYGALFIRFHVDGNPRLARGYFKDINGRLVDEFTIQVP